MLNRFIQDYIDYQNKHEDYILLQNEYFDTEIFKEIVHFMDMAFPEWKSNKGIGFYAPEFVLTTIQNCDYLIEAETLNLNLLYAELVLEYPKSKASYELSFEEYFDNYFFAKLEDDSFEATSHQQQEEVYRNYFERVITYIPYDFIGNNF